MKRTISLTLITFFVSVLALPLFAAADNCDMPCCRINVPCCETEDVTLECPALAQGQDRASILLPMLPRPVKSEFCSVFYLSEVPDSDFDSNKGTCLPFDGQVSYHKVPYYFLTHSLLI